ncbi:uncharacterized protein ASCRUDRAFT_8461 [Ascoidea rubescens DSM 1968]|uniref:Acid protease n=1 Tax=Ascoidea rubescens DSM 1968 TaxID=1344418 RepID=A0A1D2VH00_9ASCO|nr:hypothetical protein ASCRUDRAFT_8461 [Ascoidea rubescens DSM 1968]ODV60879.1 hypothetical protein ASCRUDRAFT_8461 [Ascoidea rubescens DSM 1968]
MTSSNTYVFSLMNVWCNDPSIRLKNSDFGKIANSVSYFHNYNCRYGTYFHANSTAFKSINAVFYDENSTSVPYGVVSEDIFSFNENDDLKISSFTFGYIYNDPGINESYPSSGQFGLLDNQNNSFWNRLEDESLIKRKVLSYGSHFQEIVQDNNSFKNLSKNKILIGAYDKNKFQEDLLTTLPMEKRLYSQFPKSIFKKFISNEYTNYCVNNVTSKNERKKCINSVLDGYVSFNFSGYILDIPMSEFFYSKYSTSLEREITHNTSFIDESTDNFFVLRSLFLSNLYLSIDFNYNTISLGRSYKNVDLNSTTEDIQIISEDSSLLPSATYAKYYTDSFYSTETVITIVQSAYTGTSVLTINGTLTTKTLSSKRYKETISETFYSSQDLSSFIEKYKTLTLNSSVYAGFEDSKISSSKSSRLRASIVNTFLYIILGSSISFLALL